MRLFHRMGLQLRADAHGVMDSIEDRGLLMKQHLREAELALDRKRALVQALDEEARRLEEAERHEQSCIARLDEDVALALQGGKDELARFALRRLVPHRRSLEALHERRAELERERARHAETLAGQEQAFTALRDRVRARLAVLEHAGPDADELGESVADEEIELELLRRRGALGEAGVTARSEGDEQ